MHFSWWTFLFEVVNFVVLVYVLHRLLYRPLRDAIDSRREANARAQAEAEKARLEAEVLQKGLREQIAETEQQRQGLIHQAREQAEAERKKLLAEAERARQQQAEESRNALKREREEALEALGDEVVAQAVGLARRLLSEAAESTLHRQLALRLVEALRQMRAGETEQLRSGWQPGDAAVLESAESLDADTLEQITVAVSDALGQQVPLTVQPRPGLLGGVRLRLAGHVWDNTVAGQVAAGTDGAP
jgi:F-type H+-transporting ATPase subunit b